MLFDDGGNEMSFSIIVYVCKCVCIGACMYACVTDDDCGGALRTTDSIAAMITTIADRLSVFSKSSLNSTERRNLLRFVAAIVIATTVTASAVVVICAPSTIVFNQLSR